MAVTLTASEGVLALPVFLMHSLWMLFVPEPLAASSHLFTCSSCLTVTFQGVTIISSRRARQHTNGERTQYRTWDMHAYAYSNS